MSSLILYVYLRLFCLEDDDNIYSLQLGFRPVAAVLKSHLEISQFFFLFSLIY